MRSHLPCGACSMLVPAETGCTHYRPKTRAALADPARVDPKRKAERARAAARAAEAVANFRRMMST